MSVTFQQGLILDCHHVVVSGTHQFTAGQGTPVKNSGFCGHWSLKNAEVLFKDSYTKESGGNYGAILLDKFSTVKPTASIFSVAFVLFFFLNGQTDVRSNL